MINQKHFIVAIILFGLFLTLPLVEAKSLFPINFKNIFSISSDNVPSPILFNNRLKIDNSMGQIAFWDENSNLTGDNALFWDNENKRLGIGTINPEFKLTIEDGGIIAKGTWNVGASLVTSGAGARLIWYPKKAAFRVGYVTGTQWDDNNIGSYSVGMGYDTMAKGSSSVAMGYQTQTNSTGYGSIAMGSHTTASKDGAIAMGSYTIANETASTAMGQGTKATEQYATSMGYFTIANGIASTAMGREITVSGDYSFGIALNDQNGAIVSQNNVMSIMGGKVGIGTVSPSYKLDVAGKVYASEGFKLPIIDNGEVPVCNAEEEGLVLIRKQDGTNLSSRKVIICMQTGDDSFSWESLLSTSWGAYAAEKEENF